MKETDQKPPIIEALGESEAFLDFQSKLSRVAAIERPVLIIGERGTGKELAAIRLHYLSRRWQRNFIPLNCAALTPTLIESELFGHEAGAFTGAKGFRKGRFEMAHQGTLFLDELGQIPGEVQEKILRVVEYNRFERVGGSRYIEVDVRIIGATNADLVSLCKENLFKADLLDRLSFEVIYVPPLRHRKNDILLLANHFAVRMSFELEKKKVPVFSKKVKIMLLEYDWPGNIRELKNVIERAVYSCEDNHIDNIEFNPFKDPYKKTVVSEKSGQSDKDLNNDKNINDLNSENFNLTKLELHEFSNFRKKIDVYFLKKALKMAAYHQANAAKLLGLSYDQFRGLFRKYKNKIID